MENLKEIHKKEDQIFEEFKNKIYPKQDLVYDGLHYLGKLQHNDDRCYWYRESGNEEEQWREYCKQNKGLVIITKDLNDTVAWDYKRRTRKKE